MTVVPKFDLVAGSKLTILDRDVVLVAGDEEGYNFCAVDSGESLYIPYLDFVSYIKLPGVKIDAQLPETGNRLQIRLGGIRTSQSLPECQREHASFHLAICQSIKLLRDKLRHEIGDKQLELSIRQLDLPPGRPSFITRVLGVDIGWFRVWQARRARSPQIAQALGARRTGSCCPARNGA